MVAVLITSQVAALVACAIYVAVDRSAALSGEDTLIAVLAGVGNAGGLIGFYRAAELGPLSVAAPIGALGAIVPVTWGLLSGDALTVLEVPGILLALGGAALAARVTATEEETYPDPRASIVWAAGSAFCFGVFLTALPHAAEGGRAWALLDARVALVAVVVIWAGRRLAAVRPGRESLLLAVPGLLLVAGTLLYTVAADHGQLSIVSVLGALFPVFTVGLAAAVLGERLSRTQALGVAAALVGVVLIAA